MTRSTLLDTINKISGFIFVQADRFEWKSNKTPPAYFPPTNLLKKKRMKVFFSKILLHPFCNFSKFENFLTFCNETPQLKWKRHFPEITSFDTHSTNLLPLPTFENNQVFSQLFNNKKTFLCI